MANCNTMRVRGTEIWSRSRVMAAWMEIEQATRPDGPTAWELEDMEEVFFTEPQWDAMLAAMTRRT